ncbi:hypothetical protein BH11VER1_BH11VER1_00850 [soil metagenome]
MEGKGWAKIVAATLALAVTVIYFGMGGEIHRPLVRLIFTYIFLPLATLEILVLLYTKWRKADSMGAAIHRFVVTIIFGMVIYGTVPIGRLLQKWEVNRARSFPERTESILDEYRKSHGAYPSELSLISPKLSTPRLLSKGWGFYVVDDDGDYRFGYEEPDGPGSWRYAGSSKQWDYHGD